DESYMFINATTYIGGVEAVTEVMVLRKRADSIIVTTDEKGVGVIHALLDRCIIVPDDVEVFGFNNTRVSLIVRPTLTTVVQPKYDIGAVAMRLLTKYMDKEEVDENTVISPHRIIERNSTKQ